MIFFWRSGRVEYRDMGVILVKKAVTNSEKRDMNAWLSRLTCKKAW
jgi:hypothetical protein